MRAELNQRRWKYGIILAVASVASLIIGGCPTNSTNIDLSSSGELVLVISRDSNATTARVTASITDSSALLLNDKVLLSDDQVLSVDGETLDPTTQTELGLDSEYTATIDVDDEYTLSFDNQGETSTTEVTPPAGFDDISPGEGDSVSRDGFVISWEAEDESSVFVDITITGLAIFYNSDGTYEQTEYEVELTDLADDGDATVSAANLLYFISGDLDVTLTRTKSLSRDLGFSDGEIRLEVVRTVTLDLVD